jgi:hypothetical protein
MKLFGIEEIGEAIGECISSNYFFGGIATVVGIVLLAKLLKQGRPYVVGATKEVISFKQWLSSSVAEGQEFWEDVVAEAKHQYKLEVEKKLEILQKQQEILQKIKATL